VLGGSATPGLDPLATWVLSWKDLKVLSDDGLNAYFLDCEVFWALMDGRLNPWSISDAVWFTFKSFTLELWFLRTNLFEAWLAFLERGRLFLTADSECLVCWAL
jgi:hypothetical protein